MKSLDGMRKAREVKAFFLAVSTVCGLVVSSRNVAFDVSAAINQDDGDAQAIRPVFFHGRQGCINGESKARSAFGQDRDT